MTRCEGRIKVGHVMATKRAKFTSHDRHARFAVAEPFATTTSTTIGVSRNIHLILSFCPTRL